jgi:hypothetical protein
MVATHGEAHDLGWRLTVFCRFGKRDDMKSIRAELPAAAVRALVSAD